MSKIKILNLFKKQSVPMSCYPEVIIKFAKGRKIWLKLTQ